MISFSMGYNAAPDANASHISSIDASNAGENPCATRSVDFNLNIDRSALTKLLAAACDTTTPLGLPVDPDV